MLNHELKTMAKLDKKQAGLRDLFREAKLGHNFTFKLPRGTKAFTPGQQGAIKRAHARVFQNQKFFLNEIRAAEKDNRLPEVQIFKLKRGQRERYEEIASGNINNKALFVKVPAVRDRKRKPKVRLLKNGRVRIKTGGLVQVYVPIDPVEFVEDPRGLVERVIREEGRGQPQSISFVFSGFVTGSAASKDVFIENAEKYIGIEAADSPEDFLDESPIGRVTGLSLNYSR